MYPYPVLDTLPTHLVHFIDSRRRALASLFASTDNNNNVEEEMDEEDEDMDEEEYSTITRLREEAESPFRSLRFLVYGGVGASGAIGALTTLTGRWVDGTGVG